LPDGGKLTLWERAGREVTRIVAASKPTHLQEKTKQELTRLMHREAQRYGIEALPAQEE